ncbi:MAG TPA: 2-phospho-L-lactate guanylyltransferase [Thermodesulfobacteriota bacterium]|nr:2-phospho-L-lactate guanylyltransferase [Thermodesulfobacteriota bacterium]
MRLGLVPVKDLSKAKQRLSSLFSQHERTAIAYAMLEDVLKALRGSRLLDRLLVVTVDANAIEIATAMGAEIIREERQEGESQSVDFASLICRDMGAESVLTIPGDIPLITTQDVDFILERERSHPSIILVPSRDEMGTNAILRKPPDVIPSRFGYDSFKKHINEAKQRNIHYEVLTIPRIALDIDEPEDLALFASEESYTKTYKELVRIGLPQKISKV